MKLVAVTQRVDVIAGRGERRDALDQAWMRLLEDCGCVGVAMPNRWSTARALWTMLPFEGLVLTGGNDLAECGGDAPERDAVEGMLLQEARIRGMPVAGICRGMQLIQQTFGVTLLPSPGHVTPRQDIWFGGRRETVNSYHTFGARESVGALEVTGVADDGIIKAVRHPDEAILGIMWHPERLLPFHDRDLQLLRALFRVSP